MSLLPTNRSNRKITARGTGYRLRQFRPLLEALEDRLTPSSLVVSTTADSGTGSLRQAITQANADTGVTDTITFSVTGAIQLQSALPALTNSMDIDGPGVSSLTVEPATGVAINIFTIDSGVTATISGLTIANGDVEGANGQPAEGGGINNAGVLNLSSCVITGNRATGAAGTPTAAPTAAEGAGIYNANSLTITDCTISNNVATGGTGNSSQGVFQPGAEGLGGGIYSSGGSIEIEHSTLSGNVAVGGSSNGFDITQAANGGNGLGGGLYLTDPNVGIGQSTLFGNQATGGIGANGANSSANGPVMAGNGGNGAGGAIYVVGANGLNVLDTLSVTIADNSSAGGAAGTGGPAGATSGTGTGGGIDDAGGPEVELSDTIVADNTATTSAPDLSGDIGSNGYNLIKNISGWTGYPSNTDLTGADPDLGPLANNGGPTETMALLPGSPAYNAGDPDYPATGVDSTDQRGFTRIVDGRVDIGAYEVQNNGPATLVVSTTADSGAGSLRQAITDANFAAGATDTITFSVTGTIQLQSPLPALTNPVNIDGPGVSLMTIEPASGVFTDIFTIDSGITVNISGLTLANGKGSGLEGSPTGFDLVVGGAINNAGTLTLNGCVITGNSVTGAAGEANFPASPTAGEGGGIYNTGTLSLMNCTLSNNTALGGIGGSFVGSAQPGAEGYGGGIYSTGGSVTIVDSTLSGNQAEGGAAAGRSAAGTAGGGNGLGGAIYVTGGATIAIYNSTIASNVAVGGVGGSGTLYSPYAPITPGTGGNGLGAGIYLDSGTVTITSGTIAGNSSTGGAGGTGGPSTSPNGSPGNGMAGGIDNAGGTVTLADTIVAINTASTSDPDVEGTIHTNGYNLIKQPAGATFIGNASADLYGVDPRLGPLENNGGPTDTRALLAGSPAINAGDPNYSATGFDATDQRGYPRVVDGRVDIGAYEVQANEPPTGSSIAAASPTVVFAVTANGGLEVYQRGAWTAIGGNGTISSISAVTDVHGNATVFAVTANHGMAEWSQSSGWQSIGGTGTIYLASAGLDPNGLADVFVITSANQLTEWSTSGGWLPSPIGGSGTILSMSAANAGTVYVATADHSVYEYGPQIGWVQLHGSGFANTVSAETNSSGQTTVFAVTTDNSLYSYTAQTGWTLLGNYIQSISAGTTSSGQADVYALTTANELANYSAASGWQVIGGANTIAQFSATSVDYVFAVGTDQSIFSYSPTSGWMTLEGPGFGVG